jgi:hypothetical protein
VPWPVLLPVSIIPVKSGELRKHLHELNPFVCICLIYTNRNESQATASICEVAVTVLR